MRASTEAVCIGRARSLVQCERRAAAVCIGRARCVCLVSTAAPRAPPWSLRRPRLDFRVYLFSFSWWVHLFMFALWAGALARTGKRGRLNRARLARSVQQHGADLFKKGMWEPLESRAPREEFHRCILGGVVAMRP